MKIICFTVLLLGLVGTAAGFGTDGEWMEYDNGTPHWLCWESQYRGTWFNQDDFIPGSAAEMEIEVTAMWFYHMTETYPWDTSETMIEYWNGDSFGPSEFITAIQITAQHYTPVYYYHDPDWICPDVNFWVVQNSELSSGGWPSLVVDGSDWSVSHSYVSDDFTIWEPWVGLSGDKSQFLISLYLEWSWLHGGSVDPVTWGGLKSVFN